MKQAQPALADFNQIDLTDERYRITRSTDLEPLSRSIDRVGLLAPPLLESKEDGYRIVAGFRRIAACRRLGWHQVEARILDSSTTPMQCLMVAISDNAFTRQLNIMEIASAVLKLSDFCNDDSFLTRTAAALGLAINPQLARKYRRLFALPGPVRELVASEVIALTLALELEPFDAESANAVARLFEALRPTFNQQRELLDSLRDMAANQEMKLSALLGSPFITDIVLDEQLDRKQKIAMLRDAVRTRRYPALSRAEKNFHHRLQSLNLPSGITLLAPKDFESPEYNIQVTFRTAKDLLNKTEQLQALSHHPELQAILNRNLENS